MKVLRNNGEIAEASFEDQEGKKAFWHTSAHVLAQAVKRLYPETKCAIGPAIENGFYYDFQFEFPFSEEKLAEIEAIPVGTKVNSANIISGICYIDLSKEFEENVLDTKSDLVVYSVVNSITNINGIDKIMITVEGQVLDNYRGSIDLSEPLSFNKEILK